MSEDPLPQPALIEQVENIVNTEQSQQTFGQNQSRNRSRNRMEEKSRSEEKLSQNKGPLVRFENLVEGSFSFNDDERYIFRMVSQLNVSEIRDFLAQSIPINLTKLIDSQGYSPLHLAVYKNSFKMTELLVNYILENPRIEEDFLERQRVLKKWINRQTIGEEAFTAMHFGAFNGNLEIIKYLIKHGANENLINKHKINQLHVAAQGDQPAVIGFFKQRGMSIYSRDAKDSTPLHWACYAGAESSVAYLLAWGADVNATDNQGLTPLHLSVKSAEESKSTRSLRHLLIKGADRKIKSFDGKTPKDIAAGIANPQMRQEIEMFLREPESFQCFMFKGPPLKKLQKNHRAVLMYLVFFISSFIMFYLYKYSDCKHSIMGSMRNITFGLFGLSMISFAMCWLKDPGYIQPDPNIDFMHIIEQFDPNHLCPECKIIRTERSRHCNICNHCVERFDHHCPWINNCVGANNHGSFYVYVVSTFLYIFIVLIETCIVLFHELFNSQDGYLSTTEEERASNKVHNDLQTEKAQWSVEDMPFGSQTETYVFIGSMVILFAAIMFIYPLFLLSVVQTRNMMSNMTTSERFGRKRVVKFHNTDSQSESSNAYGVESPRTGPDWFMNFLAMCHGSEPEKQAVLYNTKLKELYGEETSKMVEEAMQSKLE